MILIFGALLGFISVAFGAYAEHGLSKVVTDENFRFLMTAVRYNQVNAVVTVAIGLALLDSKKYSNLRILKFSGFLFILGIAMFSFSIYLSVSLDFPALVKITPLGVMTIMAAWILLLVTGVFGIKNYEVTSSNLFNIYEWIYNGTRQSKKYIWHRSATLLHRANDWVL